MTPGDDGYTSDSDMRQRRLASKAPPPKLAPLPPPNAKRIADTIEQLLAKGRDNITLRRITAEGVLTLLRAIPPTTDDKP